MKKLQLDDLVLITGPAHYEKAKVVKVDRKTGVITLDNQMQITQDYKNITRTQMKAEPWDEGKFEFLHANSLFEANLRTLVQHKTHLQPEAIISINNRLEKWIQKYNLKKI